MFGGKIRNLSVTGELGDFAFPDVKCDSFYGDVCFDAVAKVLLAPCGCKLRGNVFNLGDDYNYESEMIKPRSFAIVKWKSGIPTRRSASF